MLIAVIIFGLIIGSFSNVVIYRLPRRESIVRPASHCVVCNKEIKWYDNIPLLSFLILRGKCRHCKARISWRYPLVEALYGLLYGFSYIKYGLDIQFAFAVIFITLLIWIMFIDIDSHIIPDSLNIGICALGIIQIGYLYFWGDKSDILLRVTGFVGGFLFLYLIRHIATVAYKKEAMGFGDVKLLASGGLVLGIYNILLAFLFSAVIGGLVAFILLSSKKRRKGAEMAFGPFLVTGMIIALFFGSAVIGWYLKLFV